MLQTKRGFKVFGDAFSGEGFVSEHQHQPTHPNFLRISKLKTEEIFSYVFLHVLKQLHVFIMQVLARLPEVFHLDLGEEDILKCIEKVKALDLMNPDIDKFVDALVDLCIGVQVGHRTTSQIFEKHTKQIYRMSKSRCVGPFFHSFASAYRITLRYMWRGRRSRASFPE